MREYKRYDNYKSVKLDWIDEIPKHWDKIKISHYFKIGRGRVISKGEIANNKGEYPVYSSQTENNGVLGFLNSYDFEGDYITWTTDGANAGTVFRRKGKFNCTNVCGTLEKIKEVNLTYSKYCLSVVTKRHVRKDINPKLMNNTMAEIRILKPKILEQQKIASFLDQKTTEIDKIITKKESLIDQLEKYKESVITEAVTKGKLGDKYINEDGELIDEIEMKDSGVEWIGNIPKHFYIVPIKRLLIGIKDGTHGSHSRVSSGELLLSAKNVYNSGIKINNDESIITEKEYKKIISNGYPRKGDILFTCVGTIGRCCVYKKDKPLAFQRSVSFLRFSNNTNKEFYKYVLQSTFFQEQIQMKLKSTAQSGIYMGDIENTNIVKVDLKIQNRISTFLENKMKELNNLIQKTKQSIEKYKEYKKSLIFEAVTGKIDLRDYELEGGEELAEHNNSSETERKCISAVD